MTENEELSGKRKNDYDLFWTGIEKMTGSHIPVYIRDVLNENGYNSPLSLGLLDEEDLIDMESKVRKRSEETIDNPDAHRLTDAPFKSMAEFYFPRGYK